MRPHHPPRFHRDVVVRTQQPALADMGLAELVVAARDGDSGAFGTLYGAHAPAVRRIVLDNVHQAHDVEDVVQEVFARAFRRLSSLREPERFLPWLYSIARRAAIDHRRVRVAGRSVVDADPAEHVAAADLGPDDLLMLREELRVLQLATARLSDRDVTALNLVGHLGLGPAEIAAALGVTPGAAKVIVHRARQRLRAALGEPEALDEPGGDGHIA